MSWIPKLTPLVCPFCGTACDFPESSTSKPIRLGESAGFDRDDLLSPCGCGARLFVETEIYDDLAQLVEWAEKCGKTVETNLLDKVDFYGPIAFEGQEPRDPTGPYDGDWVDALFYRVS